MPKRDEQLQAPDAHQQPAVAKQPRLQGLAVGRIVQYVDPDTGAHWAAIVVHVHALSGIVNLTVFPPTALPKNVTSIVFNENPVPGSWHWPERA